MDLFTQNTENQEVTEINSSNTSTTTTDNQGVRELSNKEKKKILMMGDVSFNIEGKKEYQRGLNGKVGMHPSIFTVSSDAGAINTKYFSGMNVIKWGTKSVTLYTFDMLSKKTTGKIYYSNITIIK